ncbi:Ser/Thr protein kinase RdoA (MazF antagonist) [Deinococcus sp. HSC-46F16]|uniref:phosphotransferase enzyme family protein n=1 Tax=Deinococcus sp. HSC-46F16 TaxID=2910968 RepID=UPI0020A1A8B1|nr:Ser/Thr protein kinase RdoA (MazF antagonist) [Deinococcus sp. HSC-46F16]
MSLSPGATPPAVPLALLEEVITTYDLPGPVSLAWLRRGFNDHYEVTAGAARFILRVYLPDKPYIRSPSDFQAEVDALNVFATEGLPVSAPVPDRHGALLKVLDTDGQRRPLALFTYAHGEERHGRDFTETAARDLGTTLAQLHLVADERNLGQGRYTLDEEFLVDRPIAALRRALGPDADGLEAYGKTLKAGLRNLPRAQGAFGFIHGDLHTGNLRVEQGRCTVFDFDHGGQGWRAYDLAVLRMSLPDGPWAALLEAYRSVRPFSAEEEEALPLLARVRELWDPGDFLAMLYTGAWGPPTLPEKGLERIRTQVQGWLDVGSGTSPEERS